MNITWPASIPESVFPVRFPQLMANRIAQGFYRYRGFLVNFPKKYQGIVLARKSIKKYRETGNREYLIDAANYLMAEFERPSHPKAHWDSDARSANPSRRERRAQTVVGWFHDRDGD